MNSIKRIAQNTVLMAIANTIMPITSFILLWGIARFLGVSELGKYSFVVAMWAIFANLSFLGLDSIIIREVSKNKSAAAIYFVNVAFIGFWGALFFSLLMCFGTVILGYGDGLIWLIFLVAFAVIICPPIDCCWSIFKALEKFEYILYSTVLECSVRVFLSIYFMINGYGLEFIIVSFVISTFVNLLFCYIIINKHVIYSWSQLSIKFCKEILKESFFFAGISLITVLYWQIDVVMLARMRPMDEVGIYSAAFRLVLFLRIIPQSFALALFPVISKKFLYSTDSFEYIFTKSFKYLIVLVGPIVVGLFVTSHEAILIVFGEKYPASSSVFNILIWVLLPYCAIVVFSSLLAASGEQKLDFKIYLTSVFVHIILNLLLISLFGYVGAGIATLISTFIFLWLQGITVRKKITGRNIIEVEWKILLAILLMGWVLFFLKEMSLVISSILAILIYVVSIIIFRVFTKEEIKLFKKCFIRM